MRRSVLSSISVGLVWLLRSMGTQGVRCGQVVSLPEGYGSYPPPPKATPVIQERMGYEKPSRPHLSQAKHRKRLRQKACQKRGK